MVPLEVNCLTLHFYHYFINDKRPRVGGVRHLIYQYAPCVNVAAYIRTILLSCDLNDEIQLLIKSVVLLVLLKWNLKHSLKVNKVQLRTNCSVLFKSQIFFLSISPLLNTSPLILIVIRIDVLKFTPHHIFSWLLKTFRSKFSFN